MRAGGGKGKGGAFERTVCKQLSHWLTKGKRDDILWRSAMSGGRATVRLKSGKKSPHVSGDICAVHPAGNAFIDLFFVECKSYRDLQIAAMFFKREGGLVKFWRVAKKQAYDHNKIPLLVFKQNLHQPMVGMSGHAVKALRLQANLLDVGVSVFGLDFHAVTLENFLHFAVPPPLPSSRPRL